ncbi:TPA: hypothetical protein L4917_006422 [Pseudomonas aeruginosa]|nr:hypothetical protein [Pseudomonas aeruginosa]HBO7065478.1 hypothetical protein [Pseudomonas aeruginosa]HBO7158474.1 hypothetical protein [Pseudomonas aeruginosa]HBO7499592.1 hypothetical protein [Pseudomonas aeruginosa]HBO7928890.1 hypothetical protein [Pseudomonas aeruginosa]
MNDRAVDPLWDQPFLAAYTAVNIHSGQQRSDSHFLAAYTAVNRMVSPPA